MTRAAARAAPQVRSLKCLKARLLRYLENNRDDLFKKSARGGPLLTRGNFAIGAGAACPFNEKFRGCKGFRVKPCRNGSSTVHCVRSVEQQLAAKKVKRVHYDAYLLAKDVLEKVDPEYAGGEYRVQFAYMNDPSHRVSKHKDSSDVNFQYALSLGNFSGAKLRAYNEDETNWKDFDYKGRVLRVDGRLSHEVVLDHFVGDRYTIIFYKNYDHRYKTPFGDKPLMLTPCFVNESKL